MITIYGETLVEGSRGPGQDRAAFFVRGRTGVAVLADGAGGTSGGAEAADAVVEAVRARTDTVLEEELQDAVGWVAFLATVDQKLASDRNCGETTAVVVVLSPSFRVVGASVGDSGAWSVWREGHADLTRNQKRKPLLGSRAAHPVPFSVPERHTILVASDGLFAYARPRDIYAAVATQEPARRLIHSVRLAGGSLRDDCAVVLCAHRSELKRPWRDVGPEHQAAWNDALRRWYDAEGRTVETCPACGKAGLRVFYSGRAGERGGSWVFCPDCFRYEHGSARVPAWWHGPQAPLGELEHPPDWLEEHWDELMPHR